MATIQAQMLDLAMRRPGRWTALVAVTVVLLTLAEITVSLAL